MQVASHATKKKSWLPEIDTPGYHILLGAVAIFILGPLGGVTAAYMNFSLGFYVGGQVLAGILGSVVTYGYGAEGKHGANYMQTMAASVATTSAMAVVIQAMVWMGLPQPPAWQLIVFFICVGMLGVGVGMLYTPILVDRMQLMYPSGYAVANILRALTDIRLLKRSIGQLGGGTAVGLVLGIAVQALTAIAEKISSVASSASWMAVRLAPGLTRFAERLDEYQFSPSTFGAGMIVGARIGIPAIVVGVIGHLMSVPTRLFPGTPYLVRIGWLEAGQPFRKIFFIIALGTILGAAMVDMTLIGFKAVARIRERASAPIEDTEQWKKTNTNNLIAWVVVWSLAVAIITPVLFHVHVLFVLIAIALVFIFVMINGISTGISDSNPISSAFVITVFVLAACGLTSQGEGLMAAAILLLCTAVGVDMQQDRSTGWRLGTNRVVQFRYQVIGVLMGAVSAVVLAKLFMSAYPALKIDQFNHHGAPGTEKWQSAMTFKFRGALQSVTDPKPYIYKALWIGVAIGFVTEALRKIIKSNPGYQRFVAGGRFGFGTDFVLDAFILPSPYASSFGGFVELLTSVWFGVGGTLTSLIQTFSEISKKQKKESALTDAELSAESEGGELPEDMSTTSLVGGGLIAGDSLAALALGIIGLLKTVLHP
jgi:uncharacterized oligopeptide transporter (OPT) family protein